MSPYGIVEPTTLGAPPTCPIGPARSRLASGGVRAWDVLSAHNSASFAISRVEMTSAKDGVPAIARISAPFHRTSMTCAISSLIGIATLLEPPTLTPQPQSRRPIKPTSSGTRRATLTPTRADELSA